MAYTALSTVATGDLWTAANHNTYIKDNFSAVWPYTTAGDLPYATSATTLARLAMGSALQVLRVNVGGTALEYGVGGQVPLFSQVFS